MRFTLISMLVLLMICTLSDKAPAQGTKLGTPKVGRVFPQQNFGTDNHFLLREAERQLRLLDFEQAEITLEYAVAQNPQSVDALVQRAKFNRRLGRKAQAEADIASANRRNPYAADLFGYNGHYGLLNVLALLPNEEQIYALTPLERILPYYYERIDEMNNSRLMESEKLLEAIYVMETGQWKDALSLLDELILEFPASATGFELIAVISMVQEDLSRAEAALKQAVVVEPGSPLAWYHYSHLAQLQSNFSLALEYIERAITLEPDMNLAYLQRGALFGTLGMFSEGIADYNIVVNKESRLRQDALINRGITRKFAGDFQGAFADLTQVLDSSFGKADVYQHRGNLYLLFGFTNLAITDYTEAIARKDHFAEAYYNRGLAHFLRHDPLAACHDLERSTDLGFERAAEMQRFFCIE